METLRHVRSNALGIVGSRGNRPVFARGLYRMTKTTFPVQLPTHPGSPDARYYPFSGFKAYLGRVAVLDLSDWSEQSRRSGLVPNGVYHTQSTVSAVGDRFSSRICSMSEATRTRVLECRSVYTVEVGTSMSWTTHPQVLIGWSEMPTNFFFFFLWSSIRHLHPKVLCTVDGTETKVML